MDIALRILPLFSRRFHDTFATCRVSRLRRPAFGLRDLEPTAGSVIHRGVELTRLDRAALRATRRELQIIFQDPFGSLNPRKTVGATIAEAYAIHGLGDRAQRARWVTEMLDLVALPREAASRYPHEFSGGQRQRIGVARALLGM